MGKGDKKTKKGKIIMGSYGVSRSQRPKKVVFTKKVVETATKKTAKAEVKSAEVDVNEVNAVESADAKPKKTKKVAEGASEPKKAPKKEVTDEGDSKPKAKKTTTKKAEDEAPQQDLFTEEK